VVTLLVPTALVFGAGGTETAATKEVPEVWIWPSMALTDPNGSNPAKLAAVQQYVVDQVGVKPMAYVPPASDAGTKMNLILGSANERLDVFTGNWADYKEIALPINDLLDKYGPNVKKAFSPEQWAGVTDSEGNIWGIPRLGVMGHTHQTWLNDKMLNDLGLKMPKTFEEMESTFLKIRAAIPDAFILIRNLGDLRMCWAGAFTQYGYSKWPDANGNLQPAEFQPGYRDFVAKMADWYQKGYIFKESFVSHDNIEVMKGGRAAIFAGWFSQITIHFQRVLLTGAYPGLNYSFPEKFTSANGLVMTNNASPAAATMISRKSPNPEAAMQLLNWQYDPGKDNVLTVVYGIKGVDWDWADPNNKYYVDRYVTAAGEVYAGEFMIAVGLGTDTWYAPNSEDLKRHYEHIRDYALNYVNGKMPYDFDVSYDVASIKDAVPSFDDVSRMIDEETVKFITGIRPMAEWNDFIANLKKIGIDKVYAEYTKQYKAAKGK
jgi:hypothetical protein